MDFILILIGLFIFTILLGIFVRYLIHYYFSIPKYCGVKLPFKKFLQFYYLNPKHYNITYKQGNWPKWVSELYSKTSIYFSFIGYIRFCSWVRNQWKIETKRAEDVRMAYYLSIVQDDINKMREASLENMSQAIDLAKEIKSRF